jgi:hypothetical protein
MVCHKGVSGKGKVIEGLIFGKNFQIDSMILVVIKDDFPMIPSPGDMMGPPGHNHTSFASHKL